MGHSAYTTAFQASMRRTSGASAAKVVPYVMELLAPASVADVGCGVGAWLAGFHEIGGVEDYQGFDGEYIRPEQRMIPEERFTACDLSRLPLPCGRDFDLALSLEVAEHLPVECAAPFVAELVRLAPAVMFSAAVPGQGGTRHLNEQWPGWWAEHFARHGYAAVDCFRGRFWDDPEVDWWYAQNMLLYLRRDRLENLAAALAKAGAGLLDRPAASPPPALVHPRLWTKWRTRPGPLRRAARLLLRPLRRP